MHLAPGYREFLRGLIFNGGDLVYVHRAAWRRAFSDEPVPPTVTYGANGDLGSDGEGSALSSEAEELSDDASSVLSFSFSDDEGGGSSSSEEERPLRRRRLL